MFRNFHKILTPRNLKESCSCMNRNLKLVTSKYQIRCLNQDQIGAACNTAKKELFSEQDHRSSDQRENSSYRYIANAFYFSIGISLSISIYNYLKNHKSFTSFFNAKFYRNLIPSVSAALPFFNTENPDEDQSSSPNGYRKSCNFIADVVEKVSEGVVFIEIKDHRR